MKLCQGCLKTNAQFAERKSGKFFCSKECQYDYNVKKPERAQIANCKESCMTLVAIRKYVDSTVLSDFPKEIVCVMAKHLWGTRRELIWDYRERIKNCQKTCLMLIAVGKYNYFKELPKVLVPLVAKHLWNTRRESPWEPKRRF